MTRSKLTSDKMPVLDVNVTSDFRFRTYYDGRQDHFSNLSATDFSYPDDDIDHPSRSRTVQADARDTDMNFIMERYLKTGVLPQSRVEAFYGDASALPDFQTAQHILIEAREAFEALPAKVRDRFHNSPEEFLAFMGDTDNRDEAIKLGLIEPKDDPGTPPPAPKGKAAPAAPSSSGEE